MKSQPMIHSSMKNSKRTICGAGGNKVVPFAIFASKPHAADCPNCRKFHNSIKA